MSPDKKTSTPDAATLRTDSLADSVMILICMTLVQRLVGFVRAILFCRWLDAEQLGQWDMAFSFLLMAGPVCVLSLSGSFRRYVEHYRQRGQLRTLLRRTAVAYLAMAAAAVLVIRLADGWFSQLIFGTPDRVDLVLLLAGSLLGAVAFNFFFDLSAALRNMRVFAGLQLVSTMVFAVLGLALLCFWQSTAQSVVIAYGAACAFASVLGAIWLMRIWKTLPDDGDPLPQRDLWSKITPFVAWIWLSSLMANLFEIADRYMIVHYSGLSASEALAQVGEYHSSRVVPLLLVAVAGLLGLIITPHLTHDWEAGRRDRVSARLNLFLKLFGFALSVVAMLILLGAPLLFEVAFGGKFAGGRAILPWTLTYCVWFALSIVAQNYMLCSEKARLGSLALFVGLLANVGLNLLLLPRLGLLGAVLATTAANLLALALVCAFNHRLGFRMDCGTWVVFAVPGFFCLGPWVAMTVLAVVLLEAFSSNRLLSAEEKRELAQGFAQYWEKFRTLRASHRPLRSS